MHCLMNAMILSNRVRRSGVVQTAASVPSRSAPSRC